MYKDGTNRPEIDLCALGLFNVRFLLPGDISPLDTGFSDPKSLAIYRRQTIISRNPLRPKTCPFGERYEEVPSGFC